MRIFNFKFSIFKQFLISNLKFDIVYKLKIKNFKLIALLLVFILLSPQEIGAISSSDYPRLANYFLNWTISDTEAINLAKWDLLVLDMEVQEKSRAQLQKIRQLNPDIKILAYITSQEIKIDSATSYSSLRKQLIAGIPEDWYLHNSSGSRLTWWPGTHLLNVTSLAPSKNGQRFNQYLVNFVVNNLLSTGLWDGVFYDNTWDNITYFVGSDLDLNNDGVIDSNSDLRWREGMKFIYNETRRLTNNKYIIVGNGTTREYKDELNGKMLENFGSLFWSSTMNTYAYNFTSPNKPAVNIINANTANSGRTSYQEMRYGLASTLLENGYFSYDFGDTNHAQTWWYDEYNVDLGEPLSRATSQSNYNEYKPDVWQRDFTNGIVLLNSTAVSKQVNLGGEYEKIHGSQDKNINDGAIVTETQISGYDGLLLLKTFSTLEDVLFRNGDFLRFFDAVGNRVRNGFFVSESNYRGGDKIAHIDLDSNGRRDLLLVRGNKLLAWRDDGQVYMNLYPYTVNYKGELQVALGDLNLDGFLEVYVAPSAGYPLPIKIYTRHGRQMKRDWYPFGEAYAGGYSLAVGSITGTHRNDLVIAKNSQESLVSIFDYNYNLAYQWLAFGSAKFGANVATGNVDGLPGDEIVLGAGAGSVPTIKIFDKAGKQIGSGFTAYETLSKTGIEVLTADVDYDGKDEIIGMSGGF